MTFRELFKNDGDIKYKNMMLKEKNIILHARGLMNKNFLHIDIIKIKNRKGKKIYEFQAVSDK